MTIATSLFLIAVGAILKYAVTASISGIDLHVAGLILMIVGIVGLILSLAVGPDAPWRDRDPRPLP